MTRLYLPSTGAAAVSPAYAAWGDAVQASPRLKMVTTRISSAMASISLTDGVGDPNVRFLWRQYVSDPVGAQTIDGTVKGQLRVLSDGPGTWNRVCLCIKVVSNDGTTLRGTLLALGEYFANASFAISLTNRKSSDLDGLSSVVAQANDRIVVEFGCLATGGAADAMAQMSCGDDSGTDLPEDETTTAANNPWIEFSGNLFTTDYTVTPASVAMTASVPAQTSDVIAVPPAVGMILASSGGATNVLAKPGPVGVAVAIPTQAADNVADSYDPTAATPLPVINVGTPKTVIRPTTPSTLGDQTRGTQEDAGQIIGPGSGDINLFGTVIEDPQQASGVISYIKLYALVSTSDVVPAPNIYVACTTQQFILKISGGGRTTYGMVSGSVPTTTGVFDQPVWISDNITSRPTGGAWTWTDLANLVELGITAHYTLGTNEFTNLRLDEVWLEAWGPQGSDVPPIEVQTRLGNIVKTLRVITNI